MKCDLVQRLVLPVLVGSFLTGCATTKAHRPEPAQDPQRQVTELQNQLVAKDQEIQDLHYQLEASHQAIPATNFTSGSGSSDKYKIVHVAGVTGEDLQRALLRAGFDPGPIDGRLGKKTRSAVKAFQRKNGLTADGVVGEKTWSQLRSSS